MKAGSVTNLMMDGAAPVAPAVGMGATIVMWTDRHPATVEWISPSGHKIVLRGDAATRVDDHGMSDAQEWEFAPDPGGTVYAATRRKDGTYRLKGGTTRVLLGHRSRYHDYSF